MTSLRTVTASLLLLLVAASLSYAEEAATDSRFAPFAGKWHLVEVEGEHEERIGEVDRAVGDLNWVMRSIARPMLRKAVTPPDAYEFALIDERLHFAAQGNPLRPLRFDGSETESEGPRGTVKHRARNHGEQIETLWQTSEGEGGSRFRVIDDGQTLLVESTLQITAISGVEAIVTQTRFRRTPSVASAPN